MILYTLKSGVDTLHLIVDRNIPLISVLTKKVSDTTIYIEALDSTGFFDPREHQRSAIKELINKIIKDYNLVIVFSQPKPEIIFGNSSSVKKWIKNGKKLQDYWIDMLKNEKDKLFVWSNYVNQEIRGYPYKTIYEVNYFQDDPKIKIKSTEFDDLEELYASLLCRNDFNNGALIYLVRGEFNKNGKTVKNEMNDVRKAIRILRKGYHGTREMAKRSFRKLQRKFRLKEEEFTFEIYEKSEHEENIITIKPREA